jgi:hypothetical protein
MMGNFFQRGDSLRGCGKANAVYMQFMFACGINITPTEAILIYATLGLWALAGVAALVNLVMVVKTPRERRSLELSVWFSFLTVGFLGWYPLTLMSGVKVMSWISYVYGAPALVLGHSVRLFALARREAALNKDKDDISESFGLPADEPVRFGSH